MADGSATTKADWTSDQEPRWCPGCGDYSILTAMQLMLPDMDVRPENTVFISGIGCAARFPYYMNTYGMHSIHGRAPAIATGIAVARPDLDVWVITGAALKLQKEGKAVSGCILRHLNPFPKNLEGLLKSFKKVLIPEMNRGQLAMLIRSKYLVDADSFTKVQGLPFYSEELQDRVDQILEEL